MGGWVTRAWGVWCKGEPRRRWATSLVTSLLPAALGPQSWPRVSLAGAPCRGPPGLEVKLGREGSWTFW